jgi:hypothetical protein
MAIRGITMLRSIVLAVGLSFHLAACGGGSGGATSGAVASGGGGTGTGSGNQSPPVLTPGQTPPAGVHGRGYWFAFGNTGGLLPITCAVTQGTVPPGLMLGADCVLTGTPTQARSAPFDFTVTISDSSRPTPATNSVAYAVTISEPLAPTINNTPPPTATASSPYVSFQFSASDGLAPLVWTPPSAPMGGLAVSLDGVLSGTPSTAGAFPMTLVVKDALNQVSPATPFTIRVAIARPAAAFMPTGNMTVSRDGHTATLLLDGRVLIAGGGATSAELYDPTTRMFTATGYMTTGRTGHTATLLAASSLPNHGKVLLVGGTGDQTSELYDPGTGAFTATGNTVATHLGQTATLLKDGQVLVAGGETASAELFNPDSRRFTATGSMTVSRTGHTATLLPDGRVLIAGGMQDVHPIQAVPNLPGVSSTEIYDPVNGTFTPAGSMSSGRAQHNATLLANGTVLVAAGDGTAEVFSPAAGLFSVVGGSLAGYKATATLRNDGTVLVAGGTRKVSLSTAMLFAPECAGFVFTGPLIAARDGHTATLLTDGMVLIAGGTSHMRACHPGGPCSGVNTVLSSAELFK